MEYKIKNFDSLATSIERKTALLIAEAGLASIDTKNVIKRSIVYDANKNELAVFGKKFELGKYSKVLCVGFGKCAFDAVYELQNILGNKLSGGFVLSLTEGNISGIKCRVGTHPLPSAINVEATGEIMEILSNLTEDVLVLCVVSGGGSSLLCYPNAMSCETEISILNTLMHKGADIHELNTVRKHISKVKGGQLAKICYPATVMSLIFSDVPGDDLSVVASGPTVKDLTTIADASLILNKYGILEACKLPKCELVETPKDEKYFEKVSNFLAVSAKVAVTAMKERALELGYKAVIIPGVFEGEAKHLFEKIKGYSKEGTVVLGAGETIVKVIGHGTGGRNQEAVLASIEQLSSKQVFISLATDGFDNSDSAGAIADARSKDRAKRLGMYPEMYLENNDSYSFFKDLGDSLQTGLTGSNVSDLIILIN